MSQMTTRGVDYGQLFHQAPAGYVVAGPDGTILAANATMCAWTGIDALDGTRLLDLLPAGDRLMPGRNWNTTATWLNFRSNCWGRMGSASRCCSRSPGHRTTASRGT